MAFDQNTRNILQKFVSEARQLLTDEFVRQLQNDYGMDPYTGEVNALEKLQHLEDENRQTARLLRDTLDHYMESSPTDGVIEVIDRIVREQAFTILNRLCALRMAEARGFLIESIGRGYSSQGFQLYSRIAGTALGESGDTYRSYLFSIFDEFAVDLPVLFDRYSPIGRLFPKPEKLVSGNPSNPGLIEMMNSYDIAQLWIEDETIGWIYQYFNSIEERRLMRDESHIPRNSRELAVRNQFFTPRYVVEFLTDNTLGRIWYEMNKGNTDLCNLCQYLVRRSDEIFLKEEEEIPKDNLKNEDLSEEELLIQPAYIPFRKLKDPREIKMLDPACGSMHFGLYAYDLFEKIYEEAWDIEEKLGADKLFRSKDIRPLKNSYGNKEEFLQDVPRLIIEYNIHGIDIDPRAAQIAGLSLWLRAQRSWKEKGLKNIQRPEIRKSHIVCAEPMPGEKEMLKEFTNSLKPKVLGQLVEIIFDKMKLAGEAGSLLKIEEEIEEALEIAREEYNKELLRRNDSEQITMLKDMELPKQQSIFDFTDLPNKTEFWDTAEHRIINFLKEYAEHTENMSLSRKRLFADDAAKGFAFIDVSRKHFDVILMNPPFGEATISSMKYISDIYPNSKHDIYCCFIELGLTRLSVGGILGAITNRTGFFLSSSEKWRANLLGSVGSLKLFADLGDGVLDTALVETAAYCIERESVNMKCSFIRVTEENVANKEKMLKSKIDKHDIIELDIKLFKSIPGIPFAYWIGKYGISLFKRTFDLETLGFSCQQGVITADDWRFLRLKWEVDVNSDLWSLLVKGGEYSLFYSSPNLVVLSDKDFYQIETNANRKYPYLKGKAINMLHLDSTLFNKQGIYYTRRTSSEFSTRILPKYTVFSDKGPAIQEEKVLNKEYSLLLLLGITNSSAFRALLSIGLGATGAAARSYETGLVLKVPLPEIKHTDKTIIEDAVSICYKNQLSIDSLDETDSSFILPYYINKMESIQSVRELFKITIMEMNKYIDKTCELIDEIDSIIWNSYGIDTALQEKLVISIKPHNISKIEINSKSTINFCKTLISYYFGNIFGRWDIRYAIGKKELPKITNPFEPFRISSPGMLLYDKGCSAEKEAIPSNYPVRLISDIYVNDPESPFYIINKIQNVIELLWEDKSDGIEEEICNLLKIDKISDYINNPNGFFADHLKNYSKSRRKAPIYWLLSTRSGNFSLWIYYPRITNQTLYSCINNFVDPKLKEITDLINNLQLKNARNKRDDEELERLINFKNELKDFYDELLRVAKFWKPNLNDGVEVNAAPLWRLFKYLPWQKKLKETWQVIENGEADWTHLAYNIWPDRVIRKAYNDRSIAIAHDLEQDLWEEIEDGTDRDGNVKIIWVPKSLTETQLETLIKEKIENR